MEFNGNKERTSVMTLHKVTQINKIMDMLKCCFINTQSYHPRVGQNGGQFVDTLHIMRIVIEFGYWPVTFRGNLYFGNLPFNSKFSNNKTLNM